MGFAQAIATCFGSYVTFSGRAQRSEYWWFLLFILICSLVAAILDGVIFGFGTAEEPGTQILRPLVALATFLPLLAAGWRRMHDTGRPGWYLLIPLFVSLAMVAGMFFGVVGFAGLEQAGIDEDTLRSAAGGFGLAGMAIAGIAQLVISVLIIWWLTRPTAPGANAYGPVPQ